MIEVHACLDNMFPFTIQKCQFDILDQAVSSGYINKRKKALDIHEVSDWL